MMEEPVLEQAQDSDSWQRMIFLRSIPLQIRLQEIRRLIGSAEGLTCLDYGNDNGVFSLQLRRGGGVWTTVIRNRDAVAGASAILGEPVEWAEAGDLDMPDKSFDLVVIGEGLELVADSREFIAACHRVLKPDGRLLVCVPRVKSYSVHNVLRRWSYARMGWGLPPRGYTEGELFRTLKDGFDVHAMRSFSRFFVELTDILTRHAGTLAPPGWPGAGRWTKLLTTAYVLGWVGYQLDALLFFTRGFRLIAYGQRRPWLPRTTPILGDGRSISEAVLQAAPR